MSSYALGDTWYGVLGPIVDQSNTPYTPTSLTLTVYRNGSSTGQTVTSTERTTGLYDLSWTVPSGWTLGDSVHIEANADGDIIVVDRFLLSALQTDSSGYVKISDGTGAGQLAMNAGVVRADDRDGQAVARQSSLSDGTVTLNTAYDAAKGAAGDNATATGFATNTDMQTVLSRLGAWTGSGINNLLGAFRAALRKDASVPTDIGGSYDATTDSQEGIRERGDAAWGASANTSIVSKLQTLLTRTLQGVRIYHPPTGAGGTLIVHPGGVMGSDVSSNPPQWSRTDLDFMTWGTPSGLALYYRPDDSSNWTKYGELESSHDGETTLTATLKHLSESETAQITTPGRYVVTATESSSDSLTVVVSEGEIEIGASVP